MPVEQIRYKPNHALLWECPPAPYDASGGNTEGTA